MALPPPSPFTRWMWGFLAAFNLLALGFAAWMISISHRYFVERAETTTQNLAQVLEQNVKGTVRQIDLVLLSIKDEAERDKTPVGTSHMDRFIQTRFQRLEILAALQIVNGAGRVVHGASTLGGTGNFGETVFFRRLQEASSGELAISSPARGPDGAWAIVLARRLEWPDGSFAGAVLATLPTERLAQAMSQVDVGQKGSVSLRGEDRGLLARYPDPAGSRQRPLTGDTQVHGAYLEAARSGQALARFTETSVLDGQKRTYTLRRMDQPRFFILVGLAQEEYLRTWRHQAAFILVAVSGLMATSLVMGLVAQSISRRQRRDQALLATEEAKYRLLAENALDVVWSMDPDGQLTYVSPSILRQRGWTPETFMDRTFRERALSSENASLIRDRMAAARLLAPGSQPFEQDPLETTVRCKDGQEIQVEARWRIVWGEDACLLGFQGVTRDITERKRVEAERDRVIQELTQALAEVKALSGLLPICSQCKKVRDDQGYWNQIETYISEHTEATFSHGLCPDCAEEFRHEIQARRKQRDKDT